MELIAYTPPPVVLRGLDTGGDDNAERSPVIDTERARRIHDLGYRWVARYTRPDGVVLSNPKAGGDWQGCYSASISEVRDILSEGVMVWLNQFGIWRDVQGMHKAGKAAAQCARLLGCPTGIHHSMDVEGRGPKASGKTECKARIEAWGAANGAGGYKSAMYYDNIPLQGFGLYRLKGIDCYWQAGAPLSQPPMPRGAGIEQDPPRGDKPDGEMWFGDKYVAGVLVDTNTVRPDRFGSMPTFLATPDIAAAIEAEAVGQLLSRHA